LLFAGRIFFLLAPGSGCSSRCSLIPLMIPAFGALFPGSSPTWVKVLPTYGLVQAIIRVTADGDSWAQIAPSLLMLAAWGVAAFVAGAFILRRRVAML
jgi:hypothetical protein